MYWEPEKECLDREELTDLQLERLQATLNRVYAHVPFYRKEFDSLGIEPTDIKSLSDLSRVPFTTKEDLRANYPYGHFATPLRDVVRIHASSGTTGSFVAVGYSRNDLKTWGTLTARILVAGGVTKDDVAQIAFSYGLFTGGFGLTYGAERLGVSVIPTAHAKIPLQIKIMQDFKSTALLCPPSIALQILEEIQRSGIPRASLSLKWGLFGAEPWSERVRQELEDGLGITATDNYGLSEIMGPGVAGECLEKNGLHLAEDHFLAEIIDPVTLQPVPPGEMGELVVTTLTKEAFPMIRYRTGDLTQLMPGSCPCGRTGTRMRPILGRNDDIVVMRGAKVFPSQIEEVLLSTLGRLPEYRIIINREKGVDTVTTLVGLTGEGAEEGLDKFRRNLEVKLGIEITAKLADPCEFGPIEIKARRIIDNRNV
ncbi:phenylacetate--CoA ligase [bacterium]|nr:MAG: phenylacetate--CoA ligase [bacterium]